MPRNLYEPDQKNSDEDRTAQRIHGRLDPEDHKGDGRVQLASDDYDELEVDRFGVSRTLFDDDDENELDDDLYDAVDLDAFERGDGPDA